MPSGVYLKKNFGASMIKLKLQTEITFFQIFLIFALEMILLEKLKF